MTSREFKKLISESPHKDKIMENRFSFLSPVSNEEIIFEDPIMLHTFLGKEMNYWDKLQEKDITIPSQINKVQSLKSLLNVLESNAANFSIHNFSQLVANVKSQLNTYFYSDLSETEYLIDLFQKDADLFKGAYNYILRNPSGNSWMNEMEGALSMYLFQNGKKINDIRISKYDRAKMDEIYNHFNEKLSESSEQLVNHLNDANQKYDEYSGIIEKLTTEKESQFHEWFEKSQNNMVELEKLYRENLKLKAPAEYWSKKAKKLFNQGYFWLAGFGFSSMVGIIAVLIILNNLSEGALNEIFDDTTNAVKFSILVIAGLSFLAYLLRLFAKMTFSTFHIARDAEEREQLTYVYLSMKDEGNIDETERHLIMQSLFSRVDTGLLRDEGSPTMPGNIMDKFVVNKNPL